MYPIPIVLLAFNRPFVFEKVFRAVADMRPLQLFIIVDGPRDNTASDKINCKKVIDFTKQIDWNCDVKTLFRKKNLGCGESVSHGLSWVFEHVDKAVILEDDCVPHESTFLFFEEMLNYYENDQRVMTVGGENPYRHFWEYNDYSYFFAQFTYIHGWATWKRAWDLYDHEIENKWNYIKENNLLSLYFQETKSYQRWLIHTEQLLKRNVWGIRHLLSCLLNNGLTVVPNRNLITNIGYNSEGTHTKDSNSPFSNKPLETIEFPLTHPPFILPSNKEVWARKKVLEPYTPNVFTKILRRLRLI